MTTSAPNISYLRELVDEDNDLMHYVAAMERIQAWQAMVAPYIANDTNEDMELGDRPASWGNHPEYRLLDPDPDVNFFRIKAASIP